MTAQTPPPEATKTETAKEQPKPQTPQVKPKEEKQANCLACGKPIKKLKRYYRNGKFYCSKVCWRKSILKSKEEKK
jgi:predicted transcriptional regulator